MTQSPVQFRQGEQKTRSLVLALSLVGIYVLVSMILSLAVFYFSFQKATDEINESDDSEVQAPSPLLPEISRTSTSNIDQLLKGL